MAGTRRFKKRRRDPKENSGKQANNGERKAYEPIIRENVDFIKYYKKQEMVPEDEWEEFVSTMKKDLPTAFRITACSRVEANKLLDIVKGNFFEKLVNPDDGAERKPPKCLSWYPNGLGWQLDLTRKDIRRSEIFFKLHNFLISETATGYISRQETVSMIPPLLLDVHPQHKVLDMCAAPGSKTTQLIEYLQGEQPLPGGLVVANDIDNARCYMLVHQAKRLNSPAVIIINHDATALPNLIYKDDSGADAHMKFDRVLCDVPCTGDGTLRKNPDIWLKWNPANGSNLHGVQYRILKRGLELLNVGGKVVYSTCSMNPVENEAVISRILIEAKGSVELIDGRSELNGLKTRPGVTSWFPAAKDVTFFTNYEEVDEKWQTQIRPHMFPPPKGSQPLERCLRILPHDQDTGCFFVAVLKKVAQHPWVSSNIDNGLTKIEKKKEKRRKVQGYREDPFVFFSGDEEIWKSIEEFYDVKNMDPSLLLTRCADGKKKNIYFVSAAVKNVVNSNQERIKMINTGVKVFARCDNKSMGCSFRLVQEGLFTIESFIKGRRIMICKRDFIQLLEHADPKDAVGFPNLSEETKDQASGISQGSCVLEYNEKDSGLRLVVVGWRGNSTLRVYITVQEAVHFLRLMGQNVDKYEINKFNKKEVKDGNIVEKQEADESVDIEMKSDENIHGEVKSGDELAVTDC